MEITHNELHRQDKRETFNEVVATQNGIDIGILRYMEIDERIYVTWVFVEPDYRRQGVATALYLFLAQRYPQKPFYSTNRTPEGIALRSALDAQIPWIKPPDIITES